MFPEYVAYLAARRCEEIVARSALPNAPVEIGNEIRRSGERFDKLRTWLSADLRRLADRLDPAAPNYGPAPAHQQ